jgi:hypothetical protein
MGPQVGTEQYGICGVSLRHQLGLPATLTTASLDDVPTREAFNGPPRDQALHPRRRSRHLRQRVCSSS